MSGAAPGDGGHVLPRLPARSGAAGPAADPVGASDWGSRAQVGAAMRELDDLLGNRDGLWRNEAAPAGQPVAPRGLTRERLGQAWSTGLATTDDEAALASFLAECSAHWGRPLPAPAEAERPGGRLAAVHTAVGLLRAGRDPASVHDTRLRAAGAVDGTALPPHEVFVRTFAPTAPPPAGGPTAVLLVPGHATSVAGAWRRAAALNAQGHTVYAMDHAWAGRGDQPRGHLGPPATLARDVAAVLAAIQNHCRPARLVAIGSSVGAGVALLGALLRGAHGGLALEGPALDPAVPAVLEGAWFGAGWCLVEPAPGAGTAGGAGRSRLLDPGPLCAGDPLAAVRATQRAVCEGSRVPQRLEERLEGPVAALLDRIAQGQRPAAPVQLVHAAADPFADPELVRAVACALEAPLRLVPGALHLLALGEATAPVAEALAHAALVPGGPAVDPAPVRPARHGAARDRSLRFAVLAARAAAGETVLPEDAQDYVYLSVPGLFTERYPGYMREKFARMAALGLDHALVPVDTDAAVETNAAVVAESLRAATADGRQAVLLGHSKGGNDLAAALARWPALQDRVRAVVTLQAPWLGTPICDLIDDSSVLRWLGTRLVEGAWNGEVAALTGMSTAARARFVAAHPWPRSVPAVCLATALRSPSTALALPDALLRSRHGPTDGLVPVAHAVLPGSDVVFLHDVDHGGPVLPRPLGACGHLDPGDLVVALLALALERAATATPA